MAHSNWLYQTRDIMFQIKEWLGGGFSRAGRSHNNRNFAGIEIHIDLMQNLQAHIAAAEGVRQIIYGNQGFLMWRGIREHGFLAQH